MKSYLVNGLLAVVVAIVINVLIFSLGIAFGATYEVTTPQGEMVLGLVPVVIATVVPILAGFFAYWLVHKFVPKHSWRLLLVGSGVVFLASFAPFFQARYPVIQLVFLSLMHVTPVAALLLVVFKNQVKG